MVEKNTRPGRCAANASMKSHVPDSMNSSMSALALRSTLARLGRIDRGEK